MSASNFSNSLALILSYEGGFVNRADDPGGATCWGITQAKLSSYRSKQCSVADVQALTRATVAPIYQERFWTPVSADSLPSGVDLICFDASVNQGPGTAARILQRCAGVAADGQIGPVTLAAVAAIHAALMIKRIQQARLAAYQQDGGWPTFGDGWTRRLKGIALTASAWAAKWQGIAALNPIAATEAALERANGNRYERPTFTELK